MKITARMNPLLSILTGIFAVCFSLNVFAQSSSSASGMTVTYHGDEYHHRWSKQGQNEFTPKGQTNLAEWHTMLSINVHKQIVSAEQLAAIANNILALYQENGHILRADSKPRTANSPAEHFMAAVFVQPTFVETAYARLMLRDGVGVVVVYSQRFYGENAQDKVVKWIEASGKQVEDNLMSWENIPTVKALNTLPQS